jgi:hypothetical protein
MIDFPITELLDDSICLIWLERHLHPNGLYCPRCGSSLSTRAPWMTDLAAQAQVDITFAQYEDEDAHLDIHPPCDMPAEDVERLELVVGERCNELLDTGLCMVSAVSG